MKGHAPFTARNQPIRGMSYFYGSKKVAGNVNKIYIGKLEDLTIARLEEVAQEIAKPKPEKVAEKLTNVEPNAVAEKVPDSRYEALEARLQALEELVLGKVPA
jgi:hypothetical protein